MISVEKLFSKIGKDKILILILIGIILLVISIPVKSTGSGSSSTSALSSDTGSSMTIREYEEYLENKIQDTLSKVEGVGTVTAVVSLKASTQKQSTTLYASNDNIPEVEGVIIVAKGGGNGNVQSEITAAMESMLGLPANKIKVMKMS